MTSAILIGYRSYELYIFSTYYPFLSHFKFYLVGLSSVVLWKQLHVWIPSDLATDVSFHLLKLSLGHRSMLLRPLSLFGMSRFDHSILRWVNSICTSLSLESKPSWASANFLIRDEPVMLVILGYVTHLDNRMTLKKRKYHFRFLLFATVHHAAAGQPVCTWRPWPDHVYLLLPPYLDYIFLVGPLLFATCTFSVRTLCIRVLYHTVVPAFWC